MATQITISNEDYVKLDDSFHINWADKGTVMPSLPHNVADSIHYVIWNTLQGENEVQKCDANHNMIGNVALNSVSDVVHGSTTVQDLLDWGETRRTQIEAAMTACSEAMIADQEAGTTNTVNQTWRDHDPHYS